MTARPSRKGVVAGLGPARIEWAKPLGLTHSFFSNALGSNEIYSWVMRNPMPFSVKASSLWCSEIKTVFSAKSLRISVSRLTIVGVSGSVLDSKNSVRGEYFLAAFFESWYVTSIISLAS